MTQGNIGPREVQKRLLIGVAALCVGAALAVGLIVADAGRGWRIGLFVPLWLGALGLFQAREKT